MEITTEEAARVGSLVAEVETLRRRVAELEAGATESRPRFQAALLDKLGVAAVFTDSDLCIRIWNKAAEALYGYSEREAMSHTIDALLRADPNLLGQSETLLRLRRFGSIHRDVVHRDKAGGRLQIEVSMVAERDPDGAVNGVLTILRDVTNRKQAEQQREQLLDALRESEKQAAADRDAIARLQRLGSMFIHHGDLDSVLAEIVDAALGITGADFGNVQILDSVKSTLKTATRHGCPEWCQDFLNRINNGGDCRGTAFEIGRRVIIEDVERSSLLAGSSALAGLLEAGVRAVQSTPLVSRSGEPLGLLSTHWRGPLQLDDRTLRLLDLLGRQAADIIERARVQEELLRSEEHFRMLFESSPIGIMTLDEEGRLVHANPASLGIFGLASEDDVKGFSAFDDPHVTEADRVNLLRGNVVQRTISIDLDHVRSVFRGTRARQGTVELKISAHPIRTGGYQIIVKDITDRVRATEALQAALAREKAIAANCPDHILVQNLDLRYVHVLNPQLGFSAEEMLGRTDYDIGTKEDADRLTVIKRRVLETRIPEKVEVSLHSKSGAVEILDGCYLPMTDNAGELTGLIGYFRNVTEQKHAEREKARLEEQFHRAQKMEAIGTLAGGVAHDFNNILCGLMSGLTVLEIQLGALGDSYCADIRDLKDLVSRGADLAKQLATFGRRDKYEVKPLDVALVTQKTAAMFGRTRPDVTIVDDYASDLHSVLVDHAQLEQVLLNIFVNAGDAMPNGGRILLRAENVTLAKQQTEVHGVPPGRFVRLLIADTGEGMDSATRERIFDPFFTTKPQGYGTGLGLASAYGIIRNHGGIITVDSEPSRGASFSIFLPASDLPPAEKLVSRPVLRSGRGTILFVDDEEHILNFGARLVRLMGYEVVTAAGGKEAIELLGQQRERISLVILDLTMPDMNGVRTYEAIREIAPQAKVLLSSGCPADGQAKELLKRGCNGYVHKPFDAATLSEKIFAILAAGPSEYPDEASGQPPPAALHG